MLKILYYCKYYKFINYERVGFYYFVLEFIYAGLSKFTFYFKINVFVSGLIFFIIFLICYKYDLKLFTMFCEHLNNILNFRDPCVAEQKIYIENILYCLDFILERKMMFIILILIIFYKSLYYTHGLNESVRIIISFIYRRLNFLINLEIFAYLINLNGSDFIEYNFIFIISVFFLLIIRLAVFLVYKEPINFNFTHFLGLPYISIIFIFSYLIHSNYLYELLQPIWSINRNFFLLKHEDN